VGGARWCVVRACSHNTQLRAGAGSEKEAERWMECCEGIPCHVPSNTQRKDRDVLAHVESLTESLGGWVGGWVATRKASSR
jgi:hypothetical protein